MSSREQQTGVSKLHALLPEDWSIRQMSCLLKVDWHFRETCHLHLEDRKISRARNKRESRWQAACHIFLQNSSWLSMDYSVISQKKDLFITTIMRTLDATISVCTFYFTAIFYWWLQIQNTSFSA
jgi:hypothetical protein